MKNRNFVYDGWKANGFVALACELVLLAGFIALIVWGALRADALQPGGAWMIAGGAAGLLAVVIGLCGFMLLEPNEARVMVFFGNYRGTFYETGFWWVNPFMSAKPVSMRARNLNVDPIKVNDKTGNPILIGLVLVWRIKRDDIYKAVFEIDAAPAAPGQGVSASARMNVLQNFVNVQSDAALRQVAGLYAYDNTGVEAGELTLRSNSEEINAQLEQTLNDRLAMAGIEVVEALREAGAEVLGVASIFTYGMQKGLDRLAAAGVVNYSLSNLDVLAEVAAEEGYIRPEDKARLIAFRNNPSDESWINK